MLSIKSRSKEQISSGVSFLIYLITETRESKHTDTTKISDEWISNGKIGKLIIVSCIIQDLKEFEILIEHFGYKCEKTNDSIKIIPPSADFEKIMKLGFIRSQIQSINDLLSMDINATSIEDLADKLYEYDDLKIFEYTESHDYPRFRIKMPEPLLEVIFDKFFNTEKLFKEEIMSLSTVFKEQLLNYADLKKIIIRDDLNLMDFIKIHRLFILFYHLFTKKIYKVESSTATVIRSLIATFYEEKFYDILEKLASPDKVDIFLDLISWEVGEDKLFDIQYHPIINIDKSFLVCLTIIVQSNSIRNLYASEYKLNNKNLITDGLFDPLVERLSDTLTKAGIENYKHVSIKNGEIDLVAIYENTIFFFECKQSLHPTSIHDLRTTYDYINKAIDQLDKTKINFRKNNLKNDLEIKLNIDLKDIENDCYVIMLSNRVLNGNEFKYPVRNINEFKNFVLAGTMKTNQGEYLLWENNHLQLSDLLEYLSLQSRLVQLMINSFSSRILKYEITIPPIEFEEYYWDWTHTEKVLNEFTKDLKEINNN